VQVGLGALPLDPLLVLPPPSLGLAPVLQGLVDPIAELVKDVASVALGTSPPPPFCLANGAEPTQASLLFFAKVDTAF